MNDTDTVLLAGIMRRFIATGGYRDGGWIEVITEDGATVRPPHLFCVDSMVEVTPAEHAAIQRAVGESS